MLTAAGNGGDLNLTNHGFSLALICPQKLYIANKVRRTHAHAMLMVRARRAAARRCLVRFKSSSRKFNADQNRTETATISTMMRVLLLLCFIAAIGAKILEPRPFKRLIPADTLRGKDTCTTRCPISTITWVGLTKTWMIKYPPNPGARTDLTLCTSH